MILKSPIQSEPIWKLPKSCVLMCHIILETSMSNVPYAFHHSMGWCVKKSVRTFTLKKNYFVLIKKNSSQTNHIFYSWRCYHLWILFVGNNSTGLTKTQNVIKRVKWGLTGIVGTAKGFTESHCDTKMPHKSRYSIWFKRVISCKGHKRAYSDLAITVIIL